MNQMDVKTAFLYGLMDAEVYVELPPNLKDKYAKGKVCKLRKVLYRLKQALKIWYKTLYTKLKKLGFKTLLENYSIFINNRGAIVAVYVDNLLVIGPDRAEIDRVKGELAQHFQMTDMGPATYYLGIKLTRSRNRFGNKIALSQKAYIRKIPRDFKMDDCNPVTTLMEDKPLSPGPKGCSAPKELRRWYQLALRLLMYLMLCTQPDLAYTVSQLS